MRQPSIRALATALVAGTAVSAAAAGTPAAAVPAGTPAGTPAAAAPRVLTADPQPTWQTNGTVWTVEQVGGVVYVGGNFSRIRPPGAAPGTREVARDNVAAFDSNSGALLPFTHTFRATTYPFGTTKPDVSCDVDYDAETFTCDTVYEIKATPDGSSVVIGGDFTSVDGQPRSRLAQFPAGRTNGRLDPRFVPKNVTGRVRALAVSNSAVYLGGTFLGVGGYKRERLAAIDRRSGTALRFDAAADGDVLAMSLASRGRRLVVGGNFNRVNGAAMHAIAAVDPSSGSSTPWSWRGVPRSSYITDLTADGDTVYVASNGEGSWDGRAAIDPMSGRLRWFDSCLGATWALSLMGDVLYSGSHAHNCKDTPGGFPEQVKNMTNPRYYRLLAQTATGSTTILHWFPTTNGGDPRVPADETPSKLGPRAMANDGRNLWVGGQFTTVNGLPQQGLTRFTFSAKSLPPARPAAPVVTAGSRGGATINWRGVEDLDDAALTYQLYRGSTMIATVRAAGKPWALPVLTFTDAAGAAGSQYTVRAVDGHGTAGALSPAGSTSTEGSTGRRTGWDDDTGWGNDWDDRGGWDDWGW